MDSEQDLNVSAESVVSPEDLGMPQVVAGDVEAAIVLETYPQDKYQAVKEGRVTPEEFAEDLLRNVDAGIARRTQLGRA